MEKSIMPKKTHVAFYIEREIWEAFRVLAEKLGYPSMAHVLRSWINDELLTHDIDVEFKDGTKLSDHYEY